MATPEPTPTRGTTGRRAGLVTVDQALSSITNLLAVIWAAHTLSAVDFGWFSMLLLVYAFALGPIHAVVSMRVLVHPHDADNRPREVLGSATVLGLGAGAACLALGLLQVALGSRTGSATVALGLLLPLLILQDVARWIAFARATPVRAVWLDATWLALLVGAFVGLELTGTSGLLAVTLAWAGTGAVSWLLVLVQYGVPRAREVSLAWLKERWGHSWRLLVSNLTATGGALLSSVVIAWVSTPVAVAAVRASLLLGRPTAAVQAAVASSTAADIAREQPDDAGLLRHQRRTMLVSTAVALANLVVLVLLPDAVGRAVLGNVWPVIAPLMLAVALSLVAGATQSGVRAALIGRHQFQRAMIAEIVGAVLSVLALVVGAVLADAEGAVWGLVAGGMVVSACWWTALLLYLRERRAERPEAVGTLPR